MFSSYLGLCVSVQCFNFVRLTRNKYFIILWPGRFILFRFERYVLPPVLVIVGMSRLTPRSLIRDVVSTGPLTRGHLIWPPGHLSLSVTGLDGPPKFKALVMSLALNGWLWPPDLTSGPPKFVNHWPGWATNFQNLTTSLLICPKISAEGHNHTQCLDQGEGHSHAKAIASFWSCASESHSVTWQSAS